LPHALESHASYIEACLASVDLGLCCGHGCLAGTQPCLGFLSPVLGFTPGALHSAQRGTGPGRITAGAFLGHRHFKLSALQLRHSHGDGSSSLLQAEFKIAAIELGQELASLDLLMFLDVH
jgi:hypothetical protein